jgi:hypothetical protein
MVYKAGALVWIVIIYLDWNSFDLIDEAHLGIKHWVDFSHREDLVILNFHLETPRLTMPVATGT